jgi:hypothetical protein
VDPLLGAIRLPKSKQCEMLKVTLNGVWVEINQMAEFAD